MPFEFGRPLGVPGDPEFQLKVLVAVLKLLELPDGPVIEDFPTDAPVADDGITIWACPINLTAKETILSETEELILGFKQEMNQLRPWYDLAVKKRNRTTFGVSGLNLDNLADFFGSFIENSAPKNPREDLPMALTFRLAVDDLKAYYCEAATAQPAKVTPSGKQLEDWFWSETIAAKVLLEAKRVCENCNDNMLQIVGKRLLVPMTQLHRTV